MFEFLREHMRLKPAYDDEIGRSRIFYFRELGIYTEWYLAMRCEEESYRAKRYNQPLTLLLIEAVSEETKSALSEFAAWACAELRASDLPARLADGNYAVLLVDTGREDAAELAERIQTSVPDIRVGMCHGPESGATLDELRTAAARSFEEAA